MGIGEVDLFLYCETDIDVIIDQVLDMQPSPALLMIDSIQTMRTADSTSSPGSIVQVRRISAASFFLSRHCMRLDPFRASVGMLGRNRRACVD